MVAFIISFYTLYLILAIHSGDVWKEFDTKKPVGPNMCS